MDGFGSRLALLVLAVAALGVGAPASGAGIDELIAQCEACHGPGGVSGHADVPTIAGQSAAYLDRTLRTFQVWGRPCIRSAFRYGDTDRPKTDMCQVAEGLTGEDIRALAAHFSAQPFQPAAQEFDAGLAEAGRALHEQHCETCHHQGGRLNERAPRLAGQWTRYLRTALRFVPTGEHLVPPAMETTVSELGAAELDALMNYYGSQQDP
jgi:sulfide dehydrogenase cytochrome subunit